MARVFLHPAQGMRLPGRQTGNLSDDEDGVQSGSATGFSDGEEIAHARPAKVINNAFDPVNRILDKIDAELSSLTHSQGSSSTATDSTVVHMSPSQESTETSRLDSGSLTISQLGSTHKPTFSPLSSGSRHTLSSDKDTGICTGTSSMRDSHHRSRDEVRALEPGEGFKRGNLSPPRRSNSPDLAILNGHHGQSDDDKSKREQMTSSQFEAKQLDDKFKEIMQKRKGGFLTRTSADEDNQTIRTEDFADKFQDAMIYPSSDEAERLRNIEEDLRSDGGSDTDTLTQKLVSLTQPKLRKSTDGRQSPRPLPRPQRRLGPSPDIRPRKAGAPGTPPVYPKPTPTNSLPRPSTRSSIKFTPGHTSDADSVRTEDFENQFKDMIVSQGNQPIDSDADTVSNDPIHAKVKELLKATAKYAGKPLAPVSNSILKSQLKSSTDKPKSEQKSKQHVRISPKPPQYQDQNEGDDSDDTLCSEKDRVTSPRLTDYFHDFWDPNRAVWREPANFNQSANDSHLQNRAVCSGVPQRQFSKSSSFDESLSKSSLSLSTSSFSSSDKERKERAQQRNRSRQGQTIQRQGSQISSVSSAFSSTGSTFSSLSDLTDLSKRSSITHDAVFSENSTLYVGKSSKVDGNSRINETNISNERRSKENAQAWGRNPKGASNETSMRRDKHTKKKRDLIVQDDEEEEYPFAKYTFNKKPNKSDDSISSRSNSSHFSSSRDSIHSIALLKQHNHLQKSKMVASRSSTTSLLSSVTSSLNESPDSLDDLTQSLNAGATSWVKRPSFHTQLSSPASYHPEMMSLNRSRRTSPPSQPLPYNYESSSAMDNNAESLLRSFGLDEARSILPERFMKSWVDRVMFNKKSEIEQKMIMCQDPNPAYQDPYYVDDTDFLPPSVSAQQSEASTPKWQQSIDNIYAASQEQRFGIANNPRSNFRRAQTLSSSMSSFSGMSGLGSFNDNNENFESEYSKIGALPLPKENSFDKLKQILQSNNGLYKDRDMRRSRFATNRQKSLPIFLETLSEEEDDKQIKNKMGKQKRRENISNMKTFFEEDEVLSLRNSVSSSDETSISDISRKSSGSNDVFKLSETMKSLRNSIVGDIGEGSECSIEIDNIEKNHAENRVPLPSIFVAEKEVFRFDADPPSQTAPSSFPERPCSPNPDNQSKTPEAPLKSKDSLEVAEIMSPKLKTFKSSLSGSLQENDVVPQIIERPVTPVLRKEKRNSSGSSTSKYLSITSERDDKYLSPTSSIASPLLMSPITVIEVKKLDNQNDSLEMEDHKDTDSSATVNSTERHSIRNNFKTLQKISETKETTQKSQGRQRRSLGTPKELSLERRHYQCDSKLDDPESDDVFADTCLRSDKNEQVDAGLQTESDKLPPLLQLPELNHLLQEMCSKLHSKLNEDMFYMAHDRGVQCDILSYDSVQYCPNLDHSQTAFPFPNVEHLVKTEGQFPGSDCEINQVEVCFKSSKDGLGKSEDQSRAQSFDPENLSDKRFVEPKVSRPKVFKSEVFLHIGAKSYDDRLDSKNRNMNVDKTGAQNTYDNFNDVQILQLHTLPQPKIESPSHNQHHIINDDMPKRNFYGISNTHSTMLEIDVYTSKTLPKFKSCSVLIHETKMNNVDIESGALKEHNSGNSNNCHNVSDSAGKYLSTGRIETIESELKQKDKNSESLTDDANKSVIENYKTFQNANLLNGKSEYSALNKDEILKDKCIKNQSELTEDNNYDINYDSRLYCSRKEVSLCFGEIQTGTPTQQASSELEKTKRLQERYTNEVRTQNRCVVLRHSASKTDYMCKEYNEIGTEEVNEITRMNEDTENFEIVDKEITSAHGTNIQADLDCFTDQNSSFIERNFHLSSRSLDYETPKSRKNILRLSKGTAFSQSIDVSFGPEKHVTRRIKAGRECLRTSSSESGNTNRTKYSRRSVKEMIESELSLYSSDLNVNVSEVSDELEKENNEMKSDRMGIDYLCSSDDKVNLIDNQFEHDLKHVINGQQKCRNYSLNKAEVKTFCLPTVHKTCDAKDIRSEKYMDKDISRVTATDCDVDLDSKDIDSIFEEFDKLYDLSVDNQAKPDDEFVSQSQDNCRMYKPGSATQDLLDELDHEIEEIDIYASKLNQTQTHICLNCGYTVRFKLDIEDLCLDISDKVEHDYCTKCSPLEISTEQLERQRLAKYSA